MLLVVVALTGLSLAGVAPPVDPADLAPCGTPRAAAATIFSNLKDEDTDVRRALRCVEAAGTGHGERQRALVTLKAALDAVGGRVRLEELPAEAGYIDPRTFEPVVSLSRELPRLRLERLDDGQWMIPAAVLAQAQAIYDDSVTIDLAKLKTRFPPWAQRKVFGVTAWQATLLLALVLLGIATRLLVVWLFMWRSSNILAALKLSTTRDEFRRALLPLGNLALAGVVALGVPSLGFTGRLAVGVMLAVRVFAGLAFLTLCYRAIDLVAQQMTRRAAETPTKMDDHIVPLLRRVLKIVVIAIAVVVVLQAFDVNVGSLVAGLGIGGLAVALAAKDTIGNFFGSVAIFLDRPFQIGDWVVTPEVQGTIEHVGFRSTQVRTIRDTLTSVPNAKLADSVVDNFGARRFRHVRVIAGLQYDTTPEQLEAFCDGVRAIIAAHPHTRKDEVQVHFNDFQDSALAVFVQFYLVAPDYSAELRLRHEVLLDILRLARDLGVSFAFPTRTLHLGKDAGEAPQIEDLLEVIKGYGPGGDKVKAPGPRILPPPPSVPAPAPQEANAPPRNP